MNLRKNILKREIVLRLAGEGGGFTIIVFNDAGLRFEVLRQDVFSEADQNSVQRYSTLEEALDHINFGWPRLRARVVHPAFASEVYELALRRLGHSAEALEQWVEARDGGGISDNDDG